MSFNKDEYIKQMKLREKMKELENKERDTYTKYSVGYINTDDINEIQSRKKIINSIKGIKKIINQKKIKKIKNEIKELEATEEKEHNEYIRNHQKYKEELENVESEISNIQSQLDDNFTEGLYLDDSGILTISDKVNIQVSNHPSDEIMLVHSTNFFLKDKTILNNYDGKKIGEIEIEYLGVRKKVKAQSHRHTVHFVQNNVIRSTSDGAGVWEQMKFIVFEPMKEHQNQIVDNENPGDTYTYGSVKLSDKPILLVRKDAYNEIPPEEINNYEIIKYDGDFAECGRNMLKIMGLKIKEFNANAPSHSHSVEFYTEQALNERDLCINYMNDSIYDGKPLTNEEFYRLYNIYCNVVLYENGSSSKCKSKDVAPTIEDTISDKMNIPRGFVVFMVQSGIELDSNKNFTFKNDEEMYEIFKQLKVEEKVDNKNINKIKKIIDVENIKKSYEEYLEMSKVVNNENKTDLSGEGIIDVPINELHLFKNIDKAKVVNKIFKEIDEKYKKESDTIFSSRIIYDENGMNISYFDKNHGLKKITFSLKGETVKEAIANYEYSIRNIDKIIEEQQTINMPEEIESSGIRM